MMKARIMNSIRLKVTILAISFSVACPWAVHSESLAVRDCTWCHGASAQGYTPAPRLAGQRSEYIQSQLKDFWTHARDNPFSKQYMWGAAANLSPQRVHDLAVYFATLPGKPANDGNREFVARGRSIYFDGIPELNIVSCVACHGPNAEGAGAIPRLGGLDYTYLKARLEQWGEGYHAAAKAPMPRIASRLSANQIEALASYLSFVK
jgi:cytochrome c553